MQSFPSISRALYRIVFRGGSPQRIHYASSHLGWALLALILTSIATLRFEFQLGYIDVGLFLFIFLSGFYIAAALLTRRVPRPRLRLTLQAIAMILAAGFLLLLLATPLVHAFPAALLPLCVLVFLAAVSGISNCVQFALASTRIGAWISTLLFMAAVALLYSILRTLLQSVFS